MRQDQRGITIIELLTVIVMTGFFTTLLTTFTLSYWRYGYLQEADLDTLGTRLNAGDIIRESVGTSSGLVMQNSIADAHTLNADTTDVSGTHWTPIHAIPGSVAMPAKGSTLPLVYYRRPSTSTTGTYIMNGSNPYEDEYVMYLDGTTKSLMMRSLANTAATGNRLKTSCPLSAATALCPADKTIARDLSSIDMRYFSRTGNAINYTSITDPATGGYAGPDFTAVEVVEFNLNLVKKSELQKTNATQNSTIIRVALRNA
jgi:type II secretory pathway pseudopilin PulG